NPVHLVTFTQYVIVPLVAVSSSYRIRIRWASENGRRRVPHRPTCIPARAARGNAVGRIAGLNPIMHRRLFEVGEQLNERTDAIGLYTPKPTPAVWKYLEGVSVIVHGDTELFELVRALRPPRGFACRLDCRQQQSN